MLTGTMESSDSVDLIPLEHHLHELLQSLRASGSEVSWLEVQNDAQEIANHLRVRNSTGKYLLSIIIYIGPWICLRQLITIPFSGELACPRRSHLCFRSVSRDLTSLKMTKLQ